MSNFELLEENEVNESIENFDTKLPTEKASDAKRAARYANNAIFEDMDVDDILVVGAKKVETKIVDNTIFSCGLTTGLDFSKLAEMNDDWKDEKIVLATEHDLLAYSFFDKREQNESIRDFRESQKESNTEED